MMHPIFLIITFLVAAVCPIFIKNERQVRLSAVLFAALGTLVMVLTVLPGFGSSVISWSGGQWWYLDSFSALLAVLVVLVYLLATIVSFRYIGEEHHERILALRHVQLYFSLVHLFTLFMILTLLANNIILIWIALECTTLSSTFLVGIYRKDASIEAAWKYILLCSTGISLGLIGVLLMSYAVRVSGIGDGHDLFLLTFLRENAYALDPDIVRWAFIFLFIGVGTKVGLVPMHAWLPDAHSKSPSPVSALFSGILLNVALYALIRFKFITDSAVGDSVWTNKFFLVFGLLSIFLPAFILLVQKNYKRMLAYSSIEHMGLVAFAFAFGPVGMLAAIMHMIGHALVKPLLFFGAGEIFLQWKSTHTDQVHGVMKRAPYTAILFLLGILAIIAVPPSVLFVSEYTMFTAAFSNRPGFAILALIALTLIAFAMLRLTFGMLFSNEGASGSNDPKEKWQLTHTVMVVQLGIMVAVTVWCTTPSGLAFLNAIVEDIGFIAIR